MLMGAVYYASRQWGLEAVTGAYIQSWYPFVCTCTKDVETIQSMMNVPVNHQEIYQYCSEEAE